MKRVVIVAVLLAVVVTPFVVAPRFSSRTSTKDFTTEELVHEIKQRQLLSGDFEAFLEVPKLWKQLSEVLTQLPEQERQALLGQFVQSSVQRSAGDETTEEIELIVSIDTSTGGSFNRFKAYVIFSDGTRHPLDHDDTSFKTGFNETGPTMQIGILIDRSQIDLAENQNWAGSTILLTNEMTLGADPEWLFNWQAEYEIDE